MVYILIGALLLIGLDQFSKYLVVKDMTLGESREVITNFFSLTSHRNRGAAWGILQDSRLFFIIVTTIFLLGIVYYIYKHKKLSKLDIFAFSFLIGGALGNFIDRLVRREVVDFLDFKLFSYDFPIFNLADIFINIGVLLLLIKIYKEE